MFSVIIPTLQRSSFLPDLLDGLHRMPEVGEIVVINNSDRPLAGASGLAKVRVLDQGRNIYVNPAWNLGVREAKYDLICLCNDDVLVTGATFRAAAARIRRGAGIVGASPMCLLSPEQTRARLPPITVPTFLRPFGFGVFMCFARDAYRPIPDDLLIYWGDDYLFRRQDRLNYVLVGPCLRTRMSTTSGSPEFQPLKDADDLVVSQRYGEDPYRLRHWRWYRAQRLLADLTSGLADIRSRFRRRPSSPAKQHQGAR